MRARRFAPLLTRRWRWTSFAVLAFVVVIGSIALFRSSESRFEPTPRANPVVDLLGWLPATDDTRRAYAAWVDQPGAPLDLAGAIDRLSIAPEPLALGRSAEWQRVTGISASQLTGWASASGAGATILRGPLDIDAIGDHLDRSGYSSDRYRGVTIRLHSSPSTSRMIIEGDDFGALNAIALFEDTAIVGIDQDSVRAVLDAAAGARPSLAGEPTVATANVTPNLSGMMVVDQRDLAILCGVGRGWLASDFDQPSGRTLALLYHLDPATDQPVASIWTEFEDDLAAEAALPVLDADWRSGFVNQTGFGGLASNLATVRDVYRVERFVVADLVEGRDNGWIRSGVRYLVAICEQASTLIPSGAPVRATPVASPSPMEAT